MILLIDNYDSFSYNLYQLTACLKSDVNVIRNDAVTVDEIRSLRPEALILSPGPGRPDRAGICEDAVRKLKGEIPIFGVCLGHQAICEAYGGRIIYAKKLMHGKTSQINTQKGSVLFKGIDSPVNVARYHSLAADEESLPPELKVTARSADGEVMAVEDAENKVFGVQFHPESVLTPEGKIILENFFENR